MAAPTASFSPNSQNTNPRIPHIIKWIKHKVNNNKKDSSNKCVTDQRLSGSSGNGMVSGENNSNTVEDDRNRLFSISKETILSTETSVSGDSIDTTLTSFSGNTIVSDSSFERMDNGCSSKQSGITPGFSSSSNSNALVNSVVNWKNSGNCVVPVASNLSNMAASKTCSTNIITTAPPPCSMNVAICKHGSLNSRCRLCMQLPPLPPGSERVLRELQRQAKHQLRSQSQINLSTTHTSSNSKSVPSSPIANTARLQQKVFHTQLSVPSHSQNEHSSDQTNHYGFAIDSSHNRWHPRSTATSPEHLYEEIPSSFFNPHSNHVRNQQLYNNGIKSNQARKMYIGSDGLQQQNRNNTFATSNKDVNHAVNINRGKSMHAYDVHSSNSWNNVSNGHSQPGHNSVTQQGAMQLRSHEFYPQNMHSLENNNQRPSPSRQVSLGNLDFGMAKECDGFLVVPLRDRNGGAIPSSQQPQMQNNPQGVVTQNQIPTDSSRQQYWVEDQQTHHKHLTSNQHHTSDVALNKSVNNCQNHSKNILQKGHNHTVLLRHSNSYHHIVNHKASDSGFQEGGSNLELRGSTDGSHANVLNNHSETRQGSITQDTHVPLSHTRTHSVDVVGYEPTEKFSHCAKCRRPHALYHGVSSMCNSNIEDMTQELQYLDIAGLENDKYRGTASVLSSPSLLKNFATRRSAFSKYIPSSHQQNEQMSFEVIQKENGLNSNIPDTSGCSIDNYNESGVLLSDTYKRQSMSAESDYFSSNYNTSQSDNVSRTSRDFHPNQGHSTNGANYVMGSDKSNDTFSEYDIKTDSHQKTSDSGTSVEYDYYLAKVQENLRIKQEVKQIIRSSESERSDGENNWVQDDSISLTSVTSLSEMSTLPTDDSASFIRSRSQSKVNKGSPKSSSKHHAKVHHSGNPVDDYVLKMQRVRKPIRKKRKQANITKGVEYYKLPNFGSASHTSFQQQQQYSEIKTISAQGNRSPKINTKVMDISTSSSSHDKQDTASCYSLDSVKSSDKLSCRVTDFKLRDSPTTNKATSFNNNKDSTPKSLSVRATSEVCKSETGNKKTTGRSSSVYLSHNQVNNNSNNRLLSDLMRMNHDRQLFL